MEFSKSAIQELNGVLSKKTALTDKNGEARKHIQKLAIVLSEYKGKRVVSKKFVSKAFKGIALSEFPLCFSDVIKARYGFVSKKEQEAFDKDMAVLMKEMATTNIGNGLTVGAMKALKYFIATQMRQGEINEKEYNFYLDCAEIFRDYNHRDKITVKEIVASASFEAMTYGKIKNW